MRNFQEIAERTQEYNDYIREHRNNVFKAWETMQQKCKNEPFIHVVSNFLVLDLMVKEHDLSKYSAEEFVQYRQRFYPCKREIKDALEFQEAWKHHYENNSHHWEHWIGKEDGGLLQMLSYVEMILDWEAMGYKFGDNALSYYAKNKNTIWILPKYVEFVESILRKMATDD